MLKGRGKCAPKLTYLLLDNEVQIGIDLGYLMW